jgi:type I restriction enzyme S subunit
MKSAKPKGELFKYIDIDSVDNKSNIVSSIKEIPTIEAPSRASRYTEKGDVVFSMVRPYLRNIARITENECIASTGFYICSPYNCMLSKFCYYLMLSNYVVDGLNTFMKGDNSPSITKREVDNWLYPLPPMNEQYRIVAKIEEIFTILDRIELSFRMS